jgi:hypothetical protein
VARTAVISEADDVRTVRAAIRIGLVALLAAQIVGAMMIAKGIRLWPEQRRLMVVFATAAGYLLLAALVLVHVSLS